MTITRTTRAIVIIREPATGRAPRGLIPKSAKRTLTTTAMVSQNAQLTGGCYSG